jgi:hypothetical protein
MLINDDDGDDDDRGAQHSKRLLTYQLTDEPVFPLCCGRRVGRGDLDSR